MLGNSRGGERRYSSSACLACRKRKIKCNNDRPRCSNCSVYDIDCVFGDDRRRTSSTMKSINALSSRLDGLEGLLTGHRATEARRSNPPATVSSPSTSLNQLSYGSRVSPGTSGANPGQLQNASWPQTDSHYGGSDMDYWVQIAECSGLLDPVGSELQGEQAGADGETITVLDDPYDGPFVSVTDRDSRSPKRQCRPGGSRTNSDTSGQTPPSFGIHSATDHDGKHETLENELTAQLASRLGQLQFAEDGQLRYYGATSNLHMINHGLLSLFEPSICTIRTDGDMALRQRGLEWAGDAAYEEHLTNLYFAWHNPLLIEIDREIYMREKKVYEAGHDTPYYSPTLAMAILAVGAAYSSRQHPGNHDDAAEFFGSRAKALLEIEIDSPTLATAQALLILSAHEGARARDSRGWIYTGMAVQVLTDLGLHLNLEHEQVELNSTNTTGDIAELRRNIFWATYSATTLWSSYSGRPFPMNNTQHNIPEPLPPTRYKWEYYVDRAEQPPLPPGLDLSAANIVPMYITRLAIKMGKISSTLYTGLPESLTGAHLFYVAIDAELKQWKDSLPHSLHVDTSQDWRSNEGKLYLPMVLQLHMQYHEAMILLHRPFITKIRSSPGSPTPTPGTLDAASACTHSASEISRLLVLYRRQWGLQQINIQAVHVVMTAGIIHAHDCCVYSGTLARTARDGLHVCLQALGEMGQTFHSGNRGLQVVMSLLRDWQNQTFAVRKRGSSFHGHGPAGPAASSTVAA